MKYLVWGTIAFGLYTGYKFVPVLMTRSSISHAVSTELPNITERMTDKHVRTLLVRSAKVASIELDPQKIQFAVERRTGEREVSVDVEYPMMIDFFGSREFVNHVHVAEVVPVDEAAEARLAERERKHQERVQNLAKVNERIKEKKRRMIEDCERATGQKCGLQGGGSYYGMAHDDEDDVEYIPAWK